MSKLNMIIDLKFTTGPLIVTDEESFEEKSLDGKGASEFFSQIPSEELSVEVVSTNDDAEASFPVFLKNGKKGAILDVKLINDGTALDVSISGEFEIVLRSGVAQVLRTTGSNLDLRVRGLMWKGGAYNGFMAVIVGGDFDRNSENWAESFPRVSKYLIK